MATSRRDNRCMGMLPALMIALWLAGDASAPATARPNWVDPFDSPAKPSAPANASPTPRTRVPAPRGDEVQEWIRAHPKEMAIWDNYSPRSGLTPEARRCIDSSVRSLAAYSAYDPSAWRQGVTACAVYFGNADEKWKAERRRQHELARQKAERESAEERRIALDAEEKEREERQRDYEKHLPEGMKKWLGAVLGYRVALAEDSREEAKAEITKERKYSRYGGVFDKSAIYESQQQIREADETIERERQRAKDNHVKVLGRNDERIRRVEECLRSSYVSVPAPATFVVEGQDCLWIHLVVRNVDSAH